MEQIVAAVITGGLGLITGITVGYRDQIMGLLSVRQRKVDGLWSGMAEEKTGFGCSYSIHCDLKNRGVFVKGEMVFTIQLPSEKSEVDAKPITIKAVAEGKVRDNYLIIQFEDSDQQILLWGNAILRFSADRKRLTGYFTAFQAIGNELVFGNMTLERVFA